MPRGINASVLLRLLDARFTKEDQARLGMVEANVCHGPIWFNTNPDLTISLEDGAPEKALTLRIKTSGYHMIEGSRPLALVYRIYYKVFKTNLNPQALTKDPKNQTLLLQASREDININVPKMIKWEDIKLPDEWDLPKEMPPTIQTPINIAEQDNLESVVQYHDIYIYIYRFPGLHLMSTYIIIHCLGPLFVSLALEILVILLWDFYLNFI